MKKFIYKHTPLSQVLSDYSATLQTEESQYAHLNIIFRSIGEDGYEVIRVSDLPDKVKSFRNDPESLFYKDR